MPLILGAQSAVSTGFAVDNSCRFNDGDSPSLTRTSPDVASTNIYKFTMAFWTKLGVPPIAAQFFDNYPGSGDEFQFYLTAERTLRIQTYDSSNKMELIPTQLFRDKSAWYHIIFSYDSTPATPSASSIRLWVNGVEVTAFDTATYPAQNQDGCFGQRNHIQYVGVGGPGNVRYYDGYLAEYIAVDGQALVNTDFGEFDEDSPKIWKPIDISGIDCGALGFYLDFKDSSNLGNDIAGNGDFAENNIVAADQATDSPTNNFCTMNPLRYTSSGLSAAYSEGNCAFIREGTDGQMNGTMGITKGKWYWECLIDDYWQYLGWSDGNAAGHTSACSASGSHFYGMYSNASDCTSYANGSGTAQASYTAMVAGQYWGVAFDADNGEMYYSVNGVWQNSSDPAARTNPAMTSVPATNFMMPGIGQGTGSRTSTIKNNFGGCSAFDVTSANQDGNGYGNFEYAVPSGFYALCTKNLVEFG